MCNLYKQVTALASQPDGQLSGQLLVARPTAVEQFERVPEGAAQSAPLLEKSLPTGDSLET